MGDTLESFPTRPSSYDKKVGLVLQGGGALGSYQAGVYEVLACSEYSPVTLECGRAVALNQKFDARCSLRLATLTKFNDILHKVSDNRTHGDFDANNCS
jgi:hypothetical protein